jgi:hypothetical protein
MSQIGNIITELNRTGFQDSSRYSISFFGASSLTIPSERVISVDLPGPKYEFLNCNYWMGNQHFRMPVGVKFEEFLILQILVPETENEGFFRFLDAYTSSNFIQSNTGRLFNGGVPGADSFAWTRSAYGLDIEIYALDKKDTQVGRYGYYGCYLEKILPFKFSADKSEPQTITMSFIVNGMY